MFQDLKRLVLHLLVLMTKLAVVDSSKDLSQFDFKEKENGLPLKVINMWFVAEGSLSNLHKQDKITLAEVKLFRQQCGTFLMIILSKMFHKSPLSSVVKNKACLIPENLLKKKLSSESVMKNLLHYFVFTFISLLYLHQSFFYYLLCFDLVFTSLCKKSFYNLIYTKKCKDRVLVIVKNQFKIVQWFKTIYHLTSTMTLLKSYNTSVIQECTDLSMITQTHKQHIRINSKFTIYTHITQQIHNINILTRI